MSHHMSHHYDHVGALPIKRAPPTGPLPPPPPKAVLPQSPEDVVLAKAFVEKLLADANNDLKPDEAQAVLLLTKGQILALVEEKERRKSSRAPIIRAAFEHALAVVASMAAGAGAAHGDGDGEKKFPIVPVAIAAAGLAAILLMRKK